MLENIYILSFVISCQFPCIDSMIPICSSSLQSTCKNLPMYEQQMSNLKPQLAWISGYVLLGSTDLVGGLVGFVYCSLGEKLFLVGKINQVVFQVASIQVEMVEKEFARKKCSQELWLKKWSFKKSSTISTQTSCS